MTSFLRDHGAIRMTPQRKRLMQMPLTVLHSMRSYTLANLDDKCGPAHSDAMRLLDDLQAVIEFKERGDELRQAAERRKAEDEETTRRAEAFVADIRSKGVSDANALRYLRTVYCTDPKDCMVQAKAMALLHQAESFELEV